MPAHLPGHRRRPDRLSGPQFVGFGLLLFLACAALHWLLWTRTAGPGLRSQDPARRAAALKSWLQVILAVEVLGLVMAGAWLLVGRSLHLKGLGWVAPAVGLVAGNAFPLQLAVVGITRSARTAR